MVAGDDAVLVQQCLDGSQRAFQKLVDDHKKPIYNVALRMVNDPDDAADITQSVFVKAYINLHTFDRRYKLFSWLYRMSVNESINFLKQKRRFRSLDDDVASSDESADTRLDSERQSVEIQDSLMELSPDYRAVLVLRHFHDLSYQEIGRVLDVPEKTVKSRLFTARQLLKDVLLRKGVR